MTGFDPKAYWENHLRNRPGLMATGHRQFSMAYNEAMYQIATERLQSALTQARIELTGRRILDVGAGFGYFIQKYLSWGAARITGVDLAEISIQELQHTFPQQEFFQADISEENLPIPGNYDLVSAISMIFHIVDDLRFEQALKNMCQRVKPGGHLIIVDAFHRVWLPTARHARLRHLGAYQPILRERGLEIRVIYPMYYLMGQTFVPRIGPLLLNQPGMLRVVMAQERRWGSQSQPKLGWLNFLIAQRQP